MSNTHRKIRVFVASPGDVTREREHLEIVVASLNKGIADRRGVYLELKDWRQVSPNMGRPQGIIFDQIPVESWDVMVGVLWSRFGTPSGAVNRTNGKAYESGTEEEFTEAYHSWQASKKPRILFYRCLRSIDPITLDPVQFGKVKNFFEQFDAVGGEHPGLYQNYVESEDFKDLVRDHLEDLIDSTPNLNPAPPLPKGTLSNNSKPYLGPEFRNPFITGKPILYAEDFFGREKEIRYALTRLSTLQSVSIVGERRIGKTSLLHRLLQLAVDKFGPECRTAFVDLLQPSARTQAGLLREIQRQLGVSGPEDNLAGFAENLVKLNQEGAHPVVALDEIDLFVRQPGEFSQDFCEALRAIASAEQLSLLAASRVPLKTLHEQGALVSPLYNIMGTQKLGVFSPTEARAFVEHPRPGIRFAAEQVEVILDKAGGHPLHLQILCWHVALANADGRDDWYGVWEEADYEIDGML